MFDKEGNKILDAGGIENRKGNPLKEFVLLEGERLVGIESRSGDEMGAYHYDL